MKTVADGTVEGRKGILDGFHGIVHGRLGGLAHVREAPRAHGAWSRTDRQGSLRVHGCVCAFCWSDIRGRREINAYVLQDDAAVLMYGLGLAKRRPGACYAVKRRRVCGRSLCALKLQPVLTRVVRALMFYVNIHVRRSSPLSHD